MYPSAHRFAVLTGKGFRRHAERQGERKVAAVQPVAALAGVAAGEECVDVGGGFHGF